MKKILYRISMIFLSVAMLCGCFFFIGDNKAEIPTSTTVDEGVSSNSPTNNSTWGDYWTTKLRTSGKSIDKYLDIDVSYTNIGGTNYPSYLEIEIDTADELSAFAWAVNNNKSYEGLMYHSATVYLSKDIDISDYYWTPIGLFLGSFDGWGYKIKGLYLRINKTGNHGLFEKIISAEVCDVTIEGGATYYVSISDKNNDFLNVGVLSGYCDDGTTIKNVCVSGYDFDFNSNFANDDTWGVTRLGGIVGYNYPSGYITIESCSFINSKVDIAIDSIPQDNGNCFGSIVGQTGKYDTLSNCYSNSSINVVGNKLKRSFAANWSIGGIVGSSLSSITDSVFAGEIVTQSLMAGIRIYSGGICGMVLAENNQDVAITKCFNYADISHYGWYGTVGGIVGYFYNLSYQSAFSISECGNFGKIENLEERTGYDSVEDVSTKEIGGIVGSVYNARIGDCINYGEIVSDTHHANLCVGGVIGYCSGSVVDRLVNYGKISAAESGGIVGLMEESSYMTDCINWGVIDDFSFGANGQIVGYLNLSSQGWSDVIKTSSCMLVGWGSAMGIGNCGNASFTSFIQDDRVYSLHRSCRFLRAEGFTDHNGVTRKWSGEGFTENVMNGNIWSISTEVCQYFGETSKHCLVLDASLKTVTVTAKDKRGKSLKFGTDWTGQRETFSYKISSGSSVTEYKIEEKASFRFLNGANYFDNANYSNNHQNIYKISSDSYRLYSYSYYTSSGAVSMNQGMEEVGRLNYPTFQIYSPENIELALTFEADTFKLETEYQIYNPFNVKYESQYQTTSASVVGSVELSDTIASVGQEITFTATPNLGYGFLGIYKASGTIDESYALCHNYAAPYPEGLDDSIMEMGTFEGSFTIESKDPIYFVFQPIRYQIRWKKTWLGETEYGYSSSGYSDIVDTTKATYNASDLIRYNDFGYIYSITAYAKGDRNPHVFDNIETQTYTLKSNMKGTFAEYDDEIVVELDCPTESDIRNFIITAAAASGLDATEISSIYFEISREAITQRVFAEEMSDGYESYGYYSNSASGGWVTYDSMQYFDGTVEESFRMYGNNTAGFTEMQHAYFEPKTSLTSFSSSANIYEDIFYKNYTSGKIMVPMKEVMEKYYQIYWDDLEGTEPTYDLEASNDNAISIYHYFGIQQYAINVYSSAISGEEEVNIFEIDQNCVTFKNNGSSGSYYFDYVDFDNSLFGSSFMSGKVCYYSTNTLTAKATVSYVDADSGLTTNYKFSGYYVNLKDSAPKLLSYSSTYHFLVNHSGTGGGYGMRMYGSSNPVKITAKYEKVIESETGPTGTEPYYSNGIYYVYKIDHLLWISNQVANGEDFAGVTFRQQADINMGSAIMTPIGSVTTPFKGTFDGDNYLIKNLTVGNETSENVGLFGVTEGATLKNISFVGGDVKGHKNVGALVGYAKSTRIENVVNNSCDVTCYTLNTTNQYHNIYGDTTTSETNTEQANCVGGLAGLVEDCYFYAVANKKSVVGSALNKAGIAGLAEVETIFDMCYSEAAFYGHPYEKARICYGHAVCYNSYIKNGKNDTTIYLLNAGNSSAVAYTGAYYSRLQLSENVWILLNGKPQLKVFYWS